MMRTVNPEVYLRQIDHALEGMRTRELLREQKINEVQAQVRHAILLCTNPQNKNQVLQILDDISGTVNRLAADPNWPFNEAKTDPAPPPPEIPDKETES